MKPEKQTHLARNETHTYCGRPCTACNRAFNAAFFMSIPYDTRCQQCACQLMKSTTPAERFPPERTTPHEVHDQEL